MLCRKCGYELSLRAKLCPKCGTIRRRTGFNSRPELFVCIDGAFCRKWETYISFDGKPFSQICSQYHEEGETNYPTHVRLSTGIHTVTFDHYSGRTQSLSFAVDDDSHQICLRIKKYGLFTEKYTLETVTVD